MATVITDLTKTPKVITTTADTAYLLQNIGKQLVRWSLMTAAPTDPADGHMLKRSEQALAHPQTGESLYVWSEPTGGRTALTALE